MIHLLSQLDPMVWLMMVVVAVGFAVSAAVLVELLRPAATARRRFRRTLRRHTLRAARRRAERPRGPPA